MRRLVVLIALLAFGGVLSACGGDGDDGRAEDVNPDTDSLAVEAAPDGSFAYQQESLEAEAGDITVTFENEAPIAHDFCIEGPDGGEFGCTDLIADGDTTTEEFTLEPGEYTFYCSVAGHREGGMVGTLTVDESASE